MFKIKYCAVIVIAVQFLCDVQSTMDTRIINGEKAIKNQYRFYVKLTITEMKTKILVATMHECGGTLISENTVLTAAHCLRFDNPIIIVRARCGYYDAGDTGDVQKYISKQNIVHEKYNRNTLENDIGLVILNTNVKLTNAVKVIPFSCEYTGPDLSLLVIGGGLTSSKDDDLPRRLQWAILTSISNDECAAYFDDISTTLICAEGDPDIGQSTCLGDSGGPVVRKIGGQFKLVALVSFGAAGYCNSGAPSGFTRVGNYSNWIAEKTKHSVTCS